MGAASAATIAVSAMLGVISQQRSANAQRRAAQNQTNADLAAMMQRARAQAVALAQKNRAEAQALMAAAAANNQGLLASANVQGIAGIKSAAAQAGYMAKAGALSYEDALRNIELMKKDSTEQLRKLDLQQQQVEGTTKARIGASGAAFKGGAKNYHQSMVSEHDKQLGHAKSAAAQAQAAALASAKGAKEANAEQIDAVMAAAKASHAAGVKAAKAMATAGTEAARAQANALLQVAQDAMNPFERTHAAPGAGTGFGVGSWRKGLGPQALAGPTASPKMPDISKLMTGGAMGITPVQPAPVQSSYTPAQGSSQSSPFTSNAWSVPYIWDPKTNQYTWVGGGLPPPWFAAIQNMPYQGA